MRHVQSRGLLYYYHPVLICTRCLNDINIKKKSINSWKGPLCKCGPWILPPVLAFKVNECMFSVPRIRPPDIPPMGDLLKKRAPGSGR